MTPQDKEELKQLISENNQALIKEFDRKLDIRFAQHDEKLDKRFSQYDKKIGTLYNKFKEESDHKLEALIEHHDEKFNTIMEYVQDIPEIKHKLDVVFNQVGELTVKVEVIGQTVQNHEQRIQKLESKY